MPFYFLECVLLFWIPGLALLVGVWPRLTSAERGAFGRTLALMTPLTLLMEFVYLKADIWSFSQAHDPLLGVTLLGAPIEEFTFWFGATPFVLGVYLVLQRCAPAALLVTVPRRERRPAAGRARRRSG